MAGGFQPPPPGGMPPGGMPPPGAPPPGAPPPGPFGPPPPAGGPRFGPPGGYGTELPPGTRFGAGGGQGPTEQLAIASLGTGIGALAFICCCGPFSIALGVAAVVLGLVSLSKINAEPQRYGGKPIAIAGIVTGVLGVVTYPLMFVFSFTMPYIGSWTGWP